MIATSHSTFVKTFISFFYAAALCGSIGAVRAADHGDAPNVAGDQACDLADVYFFLDPNNNNKVVLIGTLHGFIVPGEAVNFAIFDPHVRYRFEIENTGDARRDAVIDVTFDKRVADPGPSPRQILQVPRAQTATVRLPNGETFTAPVFNPSLGSTPPPQMVTYNAGGTGVDFFAGEVDDPFFFDIPAFGRFIASVRNGDPDPSLLMLDFLAQRATQEIQDNGRITRSGPFHTLDRMGNPAVNVALVPFNRKDAYNAASTEDDANGQFAGGIVATLRALGTSMSNINILAGVAVVHGDFLRVDVSIPNSGPGGGGNPQASFPNGRRLRDDVIDILLNIITNGAIVTGDNVNANDVPLGNTFPFLAPPHQPRATGVIDDKTRN